MIPHVVVCFSFAALNCRYTHTLQNKDICAITSRLNCTNTVRGKHRTFLNTPSSQEAWGWADPKSELVYRKFKQTLDGDFSRGPLKCNTSTLCMFTVAWCIIDQNQPSLSPQAYFFTLLISELVLPLWLSAWTIIIMFFMAVWVSFDFFLIAEPIRCLSYYNNTISVSHFDIYFPSKSLFFFSKQTSAPLYLIKFTLKLAIFWIKSGLIWSENMWTRWIEQTYFGSAANPVIFSPNHHKLQTQASPGSLIANVNVKTEARNPG